MIDLGLFSLEKSLSEVFGRIKLEKKRCIYIFSFYLRNLSRLRGQFCSTALVIDTYVKYCSVLTQYYTIDLIENKIYILDPFFMQL